MTRPSRHSPGISGDNDVLRSFTAEGDNVRNSIVAHLEVIAAGTNGSGQILAQESTSRTGPLDGQLEINTKHKHDITE